MNPQEPEGKPACGAAPPGARSEGEAARQVREMFGRIAPRYDLLNHLLSASFDRLWRARTAHAVAKLLRRPGVRVLDLCCGTGDLTLALARAAQASRITGADFVHGMLTRAAEKSSRSGSRASYVEADALAMPFPAASFDLVTSAFGFRNLANYQRGLAEIHRLLAPGGEAGILEFCEPRGAVMGPLYRFYFRHLLPRIGGAISGDAAAYQYLPSSVARFPEPEDLSEQMRRAGFRTVTFERWTGGIVALHRGVK